MTAALTFRAATCADAALLLGWRNDSATLAASLQTHAVLPEEHERWLTATLADPQRDLRIAIEAGAPVGTVRIDTVASGGRELSWTVAPEVRGRGVGKRMVAAIAAAIGPPLFARVLPGNLASQKIAEHAGFTHRGARDGLHHYEL